MSVARSFQQVGSRSRQQQPPPIRIITYNILAEKYSGMNAYCPAKYLDWGYRCKLLLKQLECWAPDLLCLQEVQEDVFHEVLQPWMRSRGYSSLYNRRAPAEGSTTVGPMDGVSLHFRDSMFTLQASQQVRFADHAQQLLPRCCCSKHRRPQDALKNLLANTQSAGLTASAGMHSSSSVAAAVQAAAVQAAAVQAAAAAAALDAGQYNFMQALCQRQEGAVMALLQHTPSQQQLVACSTHLHWNPSFPDIKLGQAAILCHCITSFIQQQQQHQQQPRDQHHQQQQVEEHQERQPVLQQVGGRQQQSGIVQQQQEQQQQQQQQSSSLLQRPDRPQQQQQQQQQQGGTDLPASASGQRQRSLSPPQQPVDSSITNMPVVVGGDFNSLWRKYNSDSWDKGILEGKPLTSGVYQLMSSGRVRPSHRDHPARRQLCQDAGCSRWSGQQQSGQQPRDLMDYTFTSSGLQLESAQFMAHSREPTLTTRTKGFDGCLDYIWLSKQHWGVTSTLEMPYREPDEAGPPEGIAHDEFGTCPSRDFPSDHLAVGCEAVLQL